MLSILRKHAASGIIKVILGLIVVVFVFWGFEGFRADQSGRVASVNGETITIDEYRQAYNNLLERYRQQYGGQFNEELLEMLQVRKQAMDSLVNQKLMELEAKKLNLRVSDQELADYIRNIEAFHIGGVFDGGRYREILTRIRTTPEQFEQQQRLAMIIDKLRDFVVGNVRVSDSEIKEFYNWFNTSVKIKYAGFEPKKYDINRPEPEILKAYFEDNKEAFMLKPMRKVRYVHIDPQEYVAEVILSDQDIADYYDNNISEFIQEETVEASHILIRVGQEADETLWEEKKEHILNILEKARGGENFAELAKLYSEDPSAENGGQLGPITRGIMVKPFEDVAFSLKAGEISDPVRTQFGWHIIKVENVNEAKTQSLEEVRVHIENKLRETRSKEIAYDTAEEIYQVSFEGDDLLNAAEKQGVLVKTTDFFADDGPVEKSGLVRSKFTQIAFSLSDMEISEINELPDGFYIIQLIDIQDSRIPSFEEVNEKVLSNWILAKQDEIARQDAESFLDKIKAGSSMEELAEEFDVNISQSDFFGRNQSIPSLGYEPEIIKTAFGLSHEKKYPEEFIKGNSGYFIIAFMERKEPDSEDFEREKENFRQRLIMQKQMKTFEDWMMQVRNNSKISIKEDVLT